jgi:hypothetical protein
MALNPTHFVTFAMSASRGARDEFLLAATAQNLRKMA